MPLLAEPEIRAALNRLPGWQSSGSALVRTFEFADFPTAMRFVNAVAELAEAVGHHPDIDIRWNRVTLALSTHDAGGITDRDTLLAAQIEPLSSKAAI